MKSYSEEEYLVHSEEIGVLEITGMFEGDAAFKIHLPEKQPYRANIIREWNYEVKGRAALRPKAEPLSKYYLFLYLNYFYFIVLREY